MIVMKFGGSSIKTAEAMHRVHKIIAAPNQPARLIVLSALAGVTNDLIETLTCAVDHDQPFNSILERISGRHEEILNALVADVSLKAEYLDLLHSEIHRTRILLDATSTIHAESRRISDGVLSAGEILSSNLLYTVLKAQGLRVRIIDARKLITASWFKEEVVPDMKAIRTNCDQRIPLEFRQADIVITQGYIAQTPQGAPATLGRDGSDLSAALLGAALKCTEIQIWSDVDGILTADPTILPQAQPIAQMSFDEASELAYFGARVLHPATIQPAVREGIPVRILNSHKPQHPGTLILKKLQNTATQQPVKSIAYKEGITLITIESSHLLLSPGLMEAIFSILYQHSKKVYAVSKSATKISLTVENFDDQRPLKKAFSEFGKVTVAPGKALVSVVGEAMRKSTDLQWRILQLLDKNGIHPELVSQFADHISLLFIIDERHIGATVQVLHQNLIELQMKHN